MTDHESLQNVTSIPRSFLSFPRSHAQSYSGTVVTLLSKMPSIRSISQSFIVLSQTALGLRISRPRLDGISLAASESCPNAQLSCHNSSAVENLCCLNSPGGTLLQTQFWDTDPASGPRDSWTIHGLWPDNCDGTYEANCDTAREYGNVSAIIKASGNDELLDYMTKYWTSNLDSAESFWEHEWDKHGTCISTLEPDCYTEYNPTEEVPDFFQATVDLFKTLPTYSWLKAAGISPSTSNTYSASDIQGVLSGKHGADVYLGCTEDGALEEVWYFFNVKGSVQQGEFVATGPVGASSSCPDNGIKYLPKSSSGDSGGDGSSSSTVASSAPTASATTASSSAAPTPTGPVFSGKGYLNVVPAGSSDKKGCLISG